LTYGAASDREVDENTVVGYVKELSKGFEAEIEKSGVVSQLGRESSLKCATNWVVVTGGTGGLGAHIVAEAALRDDVARVVCLNRRSRSIDSRLRQEEAIRRKGILLRPDALAKIDVWVSELTKPDLGLDEDQHALLAKHATHIIHNAWLMHFSWPLKRFEPQLRIMAHLLALAGKMSASRSPGNLVTFELVSSIATVGNQPVLRGSPVVLEERVCIEHVLPTGYAVAKYICERMLDSTLHLHPTRFRATAVRLGQIAGSSYSGHWNSKEHIPFMIKSGQTVGSFPDLPGSMGWTPADVIAATLVDIATQPDDVLLHPIYHIENPTRQPWRDVAVIVADELAAAAGGSERKPAVVPFGEWIESVKTWPHALDNMPGGKNPSFTLVDFLNEHFLRMSCGGLLMATNKAREHSPTLRKQGPLSEGLIRRYIAAWRAEGFLT
jgi:thioester reductase-like protein